LIKICPVAYCSLGGGGLRFFLLRKGKRI